MQERSGKVETGEKQMKQTIWTMLMDLYEEDEARTFLVTPLFFPKWADQA